MNALKLLIAFGCCFWISCQEEPKKAGNEKVKSLNYAGLKPLINQKSEKVQVVNFWATWCAPCVKELPYFEEINRLENVEVLLVSLDFPDHKQTRLLPFLDQHRIQSEVVHLDDPNEQFWIDQISPSWSGALPATIIYNSTQRGFYEKSFTQEELNQLIETYLKP